MAHLQRRLSVHLILNFKMLQTYKRVFFTKKKFLTVYKSGSRLETGVCGRLASYR